MFSNTPSVVGMGRVPIDLSADGVFMGKYLSEITLGD